MAPSVVALLGPTNTGKTYCALDRMLAHRSGMMGFPLRLLARENYDRIVRLKGPEAAALITGEERILPRAPSYFACTVEAMPADREVDFVAVDEVQLAADRERGHIFTDRALHARGRLETMLLGAETVRPLLKRLLPDARFETRPRLSTLTYAEPRKIHRLPRRTAIIVFSLPELYQTADRMRRLVGGVALVFGALSPRTRNAQVGLYQAGEVDYLVATDAIGMGLNLDIDHVAFTALRKFDGLGPRNLTPAEIAQIAGRAGRHLKDGRFGATADLGPLPGPLVRAIESHRFDPLDRVFWRNSDLSFGTLAALRASLEARPPSPQLVRQKNADDQRALEVLARDPEIAGRCRTPDGVRRLWEVCQIPDFRNVMTDEHTRLLRDVFLHLSSPASRLPEDWVAAQVAALDRTDGDIDLLLSRMAYIRTWTYVTQRSSWLADPGFWNARTRTVEDRLSDALHERLTEQFVDRRASVLTRQEPGAVVTEVTETGEVRIQGLSVGRLEGFEFEADPGLRDSSRPLLAAANRALREHVPDRVQQLTDDPDRSFSLTTSGRLAWRGMTVARLGASDDLLAPRVEVAASPLLDPALRERVRRRVAAWLAEHLRAETMPLQALRETALSGPARALVFALVENLGSVLRRALPVPSAAVTPADRQAMIRLGVRFGHQAIYLPSLLGGSAVRLRALLVRLRFAEVTGALPTGERSVPADRGVSANVYMMCGYALLGTRAVRVDALERLASAAHRAAREATLAPSAGLAQIIGGSPEELPVILRRLGFRPGPDGTHWTRTGYGKRQRKSSGHRSRPVKPTGSRDSGSTSGAQ